MLCAYVTYAVIVYDAGHCRTEQRPHPRTADNLMLRIVYLITGRMDAFDRVPETGRRGFWPTLNSANKRSSVGHQVMINLMESNASPCWLQNISSASGYGRLTCNYFILP
ncbi:hypothetical protein GWI33_014832 [Rhynchophorus ferrugineus]|uniref:Uncharacterized protein n=1 Tax=Rhynchophorus ferrugineus TaxID=354439 RepID=A0A834I4F4_RHYFE|nr:hypothetical protein GWI33_014832 [Rhynchophorus ferrugineus]